MVGEPTKLQGGQIREETMKIMGLPSWLHWLAWYLKHMVFLVVSGILVVILLKVRFKSGFAVLKFTDASVILLFLIVYFSASVTFCFALSVLFNKANVAAAIGGLAWFVSFGPSMFTLIDYNSFSALTKFFLCLFSNSAMSFGLQVIIMYEGVNEGVQWHNLFSSPNFNDFLSMGLVIVMLFIDSLLYFAIAVYIEAVFPGEFGVPKPWYFLCTSSYWRGPSKKTQDEVVTVQGPAEKGEFFEAEPTNLKVGLQIKNLRKVFNDKPAVNNLNLNMYEDQITVLLGHNGAGKTTTMSMLTGMIRPTSGTAIINGYDIRTNIDDVRQSLGLCPQHNIIFDKLTVEEHLYFFSKLKGLPKNEIKAEIDKYIKLLELEDKRHAQSKTLSGGMKRKLCVGIALCGNSKVVMLDEPTAGMDPSARRALWKLLKTQKEGRTILLSTHFMDEADLLGDRIAIMAGGKLQCCGSSFFLKKKYGAGYSLVMDKAQNCDPKQVTALLQKYIPGIQVRTNIGSELTYVLPENQSPKFEAMFKDLESSAKKLGLLGYGISLTTMEDVFMKVGADEGIQENNVPKQARMTVGVRPHYTGGCGLIFNQIMAMLMKKALSTYRAWVQLIIMIVLPVIFLMIGILVGKTITFAGDQTPLTLELSMFDFSTVLVENIINNRYLDNYVKTLKDQGAEYEYSQNLTKSLFDIMQSSPTMAQKKYLISASFEKYQERDHITAWFNNNPFHSPGVSLSVVLDAMLKTAADCEDCHIEFINHPFNYDPEAEITRSIQPNNLGFHLAFTLSLGMAFVVALYVLFVVKERMSKSKHLQFVCGVKVMIFWLTAAIWDMFIFTLLALVIVGATYCFQERGYDTAEDIGRMLVIIMLFGWSVVPWVYLLGYVFRIPSAGFTKFTLFGVFAGPAALIIVMVLSLPMLDTYKHSESLDLWLRWLPQYVFASSIRDGYTFWAIKRSCKRCKTEPCRPYVIKKFCSDIGDGNYRWKLPGLGRNVLSALVGGLVIYIIVFCIEFNIFTKIYYMLKRQHRHRPAPSSEEDSDVAEEQQKIRNANQEEINSYTLVLRDLTKYYKKFIAVNSLCLGVKSYECFGLLGINGAGKTTTFKMMTGDLRMTTGDGFLHGLSMKKQMKKVHKIIGYCPQFDALLDDMTAKETITMYALLRGIRGKECAGLAQSLATDFDFMRHLNKKVKALSGGNKRKLSTAIAVIGDPLVIFLDEPTTGMDPATKRHLWNALCKIRDSGKCLILTSHSMEECEALCTRIAIMVNGQFKCIGSSQHLKNRFAKGYSLSIKMKKIEGRETEHYDTTAVEKFVKTRFPNSKLKEKHEELLNFNIKDTSLTWSQLFGVMEEAKRGNYNIEDYSLGQSTLEQVFLQFTRYQK